LHLLLLCPCLDDVRQTVIPGHYYNRISMFKLLDLLKSENKNVTNKKIKFIKLAFNRMN